MGWQENDHVTRATLELGEPDALYRVRPGRFLAKLALGVGLVAYGVVANYYWWGRGPARFGHLELVLLFVVPLMGASLLWHMYRNRGLCVLIYPTGLLRLLRGEVASFPWDEVDGLRLKAHNVAAAGYEYAESGAVTMCWLPARDAPIFQIWKGGLTLVRADGFEADLGPALSDFEGLAEEVQRRTFERLWPVVWANFEAGKYLRFDDLEATRAGLTVGTKFVPWREVTDVVVSQGKLTVKQTGKWLPWLVKDVAGVPNPHVFFALATEARRLAVPAAKRGEGEEEEN